MDPSPGSAGAPGLTDEDDRSLLWKARDSWGGESLEAEDTLGLFVRGEASPGCCSFLLGQEPPSPLLCPVFGKEDGDYPC